MGFPAEAIPDGALLAPHHYIYGLWAAGLVLALLWNDLRRREPAVVLALILVGLFGWYHMWKWYPVVGAILVVLAPVLAILWVLFGRFYLEEMTVWDEYPIWITIAVIFWLLIALDDAISHAFGLWTPVDYIWTEFVYQYMR